MGIISKIIEGACVQFGTHGLCGYMYLHKFVSLILMNYAFLRRYCFLSARFCNDPCSKRLEIFLSFF